LSCQTSVILLGENWLRCGENQTIATWQTSDSLTGSITRDVKTEHASEKKCHGGNAEHIVAWLPVMVLLDGKDAAAHARFSC
jgi:hypothetical protein